MPKKRESESERAGLPTVYDPHAVEHKWYPFWEKRGYFHAEYDPARERFCITIPPPNVTGSLHMGHAMQHTVHDLLARWHRMKGEVVLILPGTDHAAISTNMKVEQALAEEGLTRQQIGREAYLERLWAWTREYGGTIVRQLRALGCSYDWGRERFTLDDRYYRAVLTAFVRFYQKGWIYRGPRVVNWCPQCRTTISDLEVQHREVPGKLWHIRYPSQDGRDSIVVATTRPETMLGDTGVAVHSRDDRYRQLHGKTFILPLMGRPLPLVTDDTLVDPEFGTGAVKVTPAHDPNDFEAGIRNALDRITVIGEDGRMTDEAGAYAGLDRYEARERVVRDLEEQGLLVKTEDYPYSIGHHDKCGTVIEPLLSEQWFLSMTELAQHARGVLERGEIRYLPERFLQYTLEWLDQIRDWNISRQIWWGHRIPVYYCSSCNHPNVSATPPDRCEECGGDTLEQDPDVLDTWFSSALWPFAVLGWPEESNDLKHFHPTGLLITGRDILYLWVVRMVMTSLEFTGEIPFREVFVHPTILSEEGRRMSKSLGTGADPLDLIEKYGTDASRFGLALLCGTTQDVRFAEDRFEMCRNFCNKIWNAARFALLNLRGESTEVGPPQPAALADRWILSRYAEAREAVEQALGEYRLEEGARRLYDFFWSEFCDWYLELAKPALRSGQAASTRAVLRLVLDQTLKLMHPFIPFITEEIWQQLPRREGDPESIMVSPWPEPRLEFRDGGAESEMELLMAVIEAARSLRAEQVVAPGERVAVAVSSESPELCRLVQEQTVAIETLARAGSVSAGPVTEVSGAAKAIIWQGRPAEVRISVAMGEEEKQRQRTRLERDLTKGREREAQAQKKLGNPSFIANAPLEVVAKVRAELEEHQAALRAIEERLKEL